MTQNVIGQKFGKWTVLEDYCQDGNRMVVKVQCECGTTVIRQKNNIINGKSQGCTRCRGATSKGPRIVDDHRAFLTVYQDYKRRAKKKGLSFNIEQEVFYKETQENCYWCDEPPSKIRRSPNGTQDYIWNGLDRVDSTRGYDSNNIVPCCEYCNRMKSDMTFDEFCTRIAKISKKWPEGSCLVMCS